MQCKPRFKLTNNPTKFSLWGFSYTLKCSCPPTVYFSAECLKQTRLVDIDQVVFLVDHETCCKWRSYIRVKTISFLWHLCLFQFQEHPTHLCERLKVWKVSFTKTISYRVDSLNLFLELTNHSHFSRRFNKLYWSYIIYSNCSTSCLEK